MPTISVKFGDHDVLIRRIHYNCKLIQRNCHTFGEHRARRIRRILRAELHNHGTLGTIRLLRTSDYIADIDCKALLHLGVILHFVDLLFMFSNSGMVRLRTMEKCDPQTNHPLLCIRWAPTGCLPDVTLMISRSSATHQFEFFIAF